MPSGTTTVTFSSHDLCEHAENTKLLLLAATFAIVAMTLHSLHH